MATHGEIRAAGRLVGDALAGVVGSVAHVHCSIADRSFERWSPQTSARALHDGVAAGVYGAARVGSAALPRITAMVVAASRGETTSWRSGPTSTALAWLNGLRGDTIAERYHELALDVSLRDPARGADVAIERDALAAVFPQPTRRLVVFVHGLCETDASWWRRAERWHGDPTVDYGAQLSDDLGYTPLYVRYNSGQPVSDNGLALDHLLEAVVDAWPTGVDEVVLIGHSMGGLLSRSACHHGHVARHRWTALTSHVICLGTPHLGAPLEQGVDAAVGVLGRIPETRPLATFLDDRSAGVKDLRHGITAPDGEVPFIANAQYCFVGATITRNRDHPFGRAIGDLLVRYPSATGAGPTRRLPLRPGNGAHVGGITHLDLLNHPAVYEQIHRWLSAGPDPAS